MTSIAIVGAGQIGSRHLQALSFLNKDEYEIYVVDPSPEALTTARHRFNELKTGDHSVAYLQDLELLPSELAVVIVATGSLIRKNIVQSLLNSKTVKHLVLEKFLFPAIADYFEVKSLLDFHGTKAIVNCPRRMWDIYKEIKTLIKGPVSFEVVGNSWGLGSNGVHMLDIFSFLTDDNEIALEGSGIDEHIHESKRNGYIEFTGSLTGSTPTRSFFRCTSYNAEASPLTLFISTKTHRFVVREEGARATLHLSCYDNNWTWEEKIFNIKFQSALTHIVVKDLATTNTCELTSYETSAQLHTKILTLLLTRMGITQNKKAITCPIT